MRYTAKASIEYLQAGTGDLCQRLGITLTPMGAHTSVQGNPFSLISFFSALAAHYNMSLHEIRSKFT